MESGPQQATMSQSGIEPSAFCLVASTKPLTRQTDGRENGQRDDKHDIQNIKIFNKICL